MLCMSLVVGLGLGSTTDTAEAAKKKELKLLRISLSANGGFLSGKGVTSILPTNTGVYEITFNRDVRSCAKTAAINNTDEPGFIGVVQGSDPHGVVVAIYSLAGNRQSEPFSLA
jgi:hypothetical protein